MYLATGIENETDFTMCTSVAVVEHQDSNDTYIGKLASSEHGIHN